MMIRDRPRLSKHLVVKQQVQRTDKSSASIWLIHISPFFLSHCVLAGPRISQQHLIGVWLTCCWTLGALSKQQTP